MYAFRFRYTDGATVLAEGVKEVKYYHSGSLVQVKEDEILTHSFSTNHDLTLFADKACYSISSEGLRAIEIMK